MQLVDEYTVVKRTAAILEAEVDGEVVALDVARGQCFGLDTIGSDVWRLLESDTSVVEICSVLTSDYDVAMETCKTDVLSLLRELNSAGLIMVKDASFRRSDGGESMPL